MIEVKLPLQFQIKVINHVLANAWDGDIAELVTLLKEKKAILVMEPLHGFAVIGVITELSMNRTLFVYAASGLWYVNNNTIFQLVSYGRNLLCDFLSTITRNKTLASLLSRKNFELTVLEYTADNVTEPSQWRLTKKLR